MAAKAHREFMQMLSEARRRLGRTVAKTDEELASLETHRAGDFEDSATTELAAGVLSRLEGRARHELDEIDAAQARLAAGVFGRCEKCGGAIPIARLRAMPTARYCLTCQTRQDKAAGGA
jgi:RNA polymerase-binding protein DksA